MPLFHIHCDACEHDWEVLQKEPPKRKKCPECGKMGRRIFGTPNVIFKGDGWDTTLARKEKFRKKGFDKDTAEEFYKESIKASQENVKSGGAHYKKWVPNIKNMESQGIAKKVDVKKAKEKWKAGRKMRLKHLNKTGWDKTTRKKDK